MLGIWNRIRSIYRLSEIVITSRAYYIKVRLNWIELTMKIPVAIALVHTPVWFRWRHRDNFPFISQELTPNCLTCWVIFHQFMRQFSVAGEISFSTSSSLSCVVDRIRHAFFHFVPGTLTCRVYELKPLRRQNKCATQHETENTFYIHLRCD